MFFTCEVSLRVSVGVEVFLLSFSSVGIYFGGCAWSDAFSADMRTHFPRAMASNGETAKTTTKRSQGKLVETNTNAVAVDEQKQ